MEPLDTAANKWTFTQKILFRFFFVYFLLYRKIRIRVLRIPCDLKLKRDQKFPLDPF